MDNKNSSIPTDKITSWDANKAIQRALTKAIGRHGLGLYIYAGEDLPEDSKPAPPPKTQQSAVDEQNRRLAEKRVAAEKKLKAVQ
jgi:hypothetical protein